MTTNKIKYDKLFKNEYNEFERFNVMTHSTYSEVKLKISLMKTDNKTGKIYKFEGVDTPIDLSFLNRNLKKEFTWPISFYAVFFKFKPKIIEFLISLCEDSVDDNGITLSDLMNIQDISQFCIHSSRTLMNVSTQIFYKYKIKGPLKILKDGYFKSDDYLYSSDFSKLLPTNDYKHVDVYNDSIVYINKNFSSIGFINIKSGEIIEKSIHSSLIQPLNNYKFCKIIGSKIFFNYVKKFSYILYELDIETLKLINNSSFSTIFDRKIQFENEYCSIGYYNKKLKIKIIDKDSKHSFFQYDDINYLGKIISQQNEFVLMHNLDHTFLILDKKSQSIKQKIQLKSYFEDKELNDFIKLKENVFLSAHGKILAVWKMDYKKKTDQYDIQLIEYIDLIHLLWSDVIKLDFCPSKSQIYVHDSFDNVFVYHYNQNLYKWTSTSILHDTIFKFK